MTLSSFTPPLVMVFAPSDPTGGSGLQSDILTCASMGCHGLSIVTALSVQDSLSLEDLQAVDADLVDAQARAILEDMPIAAFKIGNLPGLSCISVLAEILADYAETPAVLDLSVLSDPPETLDVENIGLTTLDLLVPQCALVMVASDDVEVYLHWLDIDTHDLGPLAQQEKLGTTLIENGAEYVLLTDTSGPAQEIQNILMSTQGVIRTDRWPRLAGSFSGAGSTLSSSIAALIANGLDIPEAVREAQEYTWQTLSAGFRPGMGRIFPDRFFWAREVDSPPAAL